nr:RluA family pseudouridine synthase [Fusobacteriaceae bacterium]
MKNTKNGQEIKEIIEIAATIDDKGKRLDAFLQECIEGATKNYIQKLIENENVIIKGVVASKCGLKVKGNEDIIVNIPEDESIEAVPEDLPIEIIYEDNDIVIINKGADMVVHPAHGNYNGTLVNALMFHIKDLSSINGVIRPGIVHRLDKDTSGIIVVAKNDVAHIKLSEMFKEKELEKTYICICKGNFKEKEGRIENLIGRHLKDRKKMAVVEENGRVAVSNYEVLQE